MFHSAIRAFFGELGTPSAFPNDPYGALTNQAGHLCLGASLVAAYCLIYCGIMGVLHYAAAELDAGPWPAWTGVLMDGALNRDNRVTGCVFSKSAARTGDATTAIVSSSSFIVHHNAGSAVLISWIATGN
jgi:hypothetical protein